MRRLVAVAAMLLWGGMSPAQMELPPGTRSAASEPAKAADGDGAELARAEAAIEQKKYAEASAVLEAVTARSPKDGRAWYDLGFAREANGEDARAAEAYSRAVKLDASDVRSAVSLGLLLARTGDRAGAEAALEKAASMKDGEPAMKARADRALAQLHMPADPERSRDEMLAALQMSPETANDVLLSGQIAEALHEDDAAMTAYARALAMDPDDADATDALGHLLLRKGEPAKAEAVLRAGLARHADDPALLAGLAGVLLKEDRAADAVPLLVRVHAADRANLAVTRLLVHLYASEENWAGANPMYAELLAATPDDPVLLADWGDALIRQRRNGEAEAALKRAVAMADRFPTRAGLAEAAGELAFAAENNHDPETVLSAGTTRNSILAPDAKTAFLLATAHDTLHHTREAVGLYRQFLQLASDTFPDQRWQAEQRIAALSRAK